MTTATKSNSLKLIIGGVGCAALVVIVALIVAGWFFSSYNGLVNKDETVKANWAQVENVLKRRADLVPNLVETVKGSAKVDKEIFTQLAEARAKLGGGGALPEKLAAARGFEGALSRLLVVVERYPELKSQAGFRQLQDELSGTENRIAVERRRYNESVKDYNSAIRRVPGNLVASMFGFEKHEHYQIEEKDKALPKVSF